MPTASLAHLQEGETPNPSRSRFPSGCRSSVFPQPCPRQISSEEPLVQRQEPQAELLDPATAQTTARITPNPLPQAVQGCKLYEKVLGEQPAARGPREQIQFSPVSRSLPFKTKEGLCQISGWEVPVSPLTAVPVTPAACPAIQIKQC